MKQTKIEFYCDVCTEQIPCEDGKELQKKDFTVYIKSAPQQDGSQFPPMFRHLDLHICETCEARYIKEFPLTGYGSGGILDLGFKSKSEIKNEV